MEEPTVSFKQLAMTSRRLVHRLLTIGENRLELLTVELQEERERLVQAILLALGMAAFVLLAGITLTGLLVILFWNFSPATVLLGLTVLYAIVATGFYLRFARLLCDWRTLSATSEQLRKDRECLEKILF